MKNKFLKIFFIGLIPASASFAQLQNTGWKTPTATPLPNDWTSPQAAFSSDDVYTEAVHQAGCRCPFMDLSWDVGVNYTGSVIFGPYGTSDSFRTNGDSTDDWGHAWTDSELSDSNFVLRLWNSSMQWSQGFANFGFGIPAGSMVSGIEVQVEARGDSNFTKDMVDVIEVKVYYFLPTRVNEAFAPESLVSVFPNPAKSSVHIRFTEGAEIQKVQIANMQGQILAEEFFSQGISGTDHVMDVRYFAPGMYLLNFFGSGRMINAPLLIQ